MKEYTILSIISVLGVLFFEGYAKTGIFRKKLFYLYLGIILVFKLIVNGWLTGLPIVLYREPFFLGVRVMTIPLEDFFFGFSMVSLAVILWELFLEKERKVLS